MSPSNPAIALVAATHRRPRALAVLLDGLARQRLEPSRFEVAIVVDGLDETRDEYLRILEEASSTAAYRLTWALQPNAGPALARHRAIGMTAAPNLCIVDDDMDLSEDFLGAHLRALEAGGPGAVVIGKVVPEEGWETQPLYESFRTRFMLKMHEDFETGRRTPGPAAFVTQNVSLSRKTYEDVGGLDADLRLGEDTEMGIRLQRAGYRFAFAPETSAVHRSRIGSYESWLSRQVRYGECAFLVYEKLGRDPAAHPLRNLVNGNPLKAAIVHSTCWADTVASASIAALRSLGAVLSGMRLLTPAIATHNAIHAIAYHVGVRRSLGSWRSVLEAERAFASDPERPLDPI